MEIGNEERAFGSAERTDETADGAQTPFGEKEEARGEESGGARAEETNRGAETARGREETARSGRREGRIMRAVDIAETALFAALMVAGAFITIPFPLVPLTFQTVVCAAAGLFLGWKKGTLAMLAYLVAGLIGIPVFAAGGGIYYVVKPSFGYILGFVAGAFAAGMIRGKSAKAPLCRYLLGGLGAFVADYAIGIVYFIAVWQLSGYAGLGGAIVTYNLVYMPKDVVLCLLAGTLAWKLAPAVAAIRKGKAE